jgi:phenylalanyl-tRNA synthetase beta chain
VLNPTSIEQSVLRSSLIPGLLSVVKRNYDFQNHDIKAFEIGKIHFKIDDHYKEQSMACCILSGMIAPHQWDCDDREVDFFDLKGIIEALFHEIGAEDIIFERSTFPLFHPGRQAKIFSKGLEVGSIGEIHPKLQQKIDVPQRIYAAELNLHDLYSIRHKATKMEPLPLYPSSSRDWTVTVREEVPVSQLFNAIRTIDSPYLEAVKLKYIYRSEKLGEKKKNVTIHFIYRDLKETIENKTVDLEHARVVEIASHAIKEV